MRLIFSQRTCPIHFFRPKTKFLAGFARFRCREEPVVNRVLGYIQCTTLCFRSCALFFCNEQAQSTSLGPILSFWVVLRDSVAGRYPLCDRVLGCIKCTTLCFRSCVLFSQRTCPIHFFRPKTKFLGGFARFRCREVPVVRSGFGAWGAYNAPLYATEVASCFFCNEHAQSTSLGPKLSFWVVSRDSVAGRYPL